MPVGTRLAFFDSWKTKSVPNTKTQSLSLFKREQQYNMICRIFIAGKRTLENNPFLHGQYD